MRVPADLVDLVQLALTTSTIVAILFVEKVDHHFVSLIVIDQL